MSEKLHSQDDYVQVKVTDVWY